MRPLLSAERVRSLLEYDPATGSFVWLVKRKGTSGRGTAAGTTNAQGRSVICIDGRNYLAYRLVWLYVFGEWPRGMIDHINGDPSDNRLGNLRDVSTAVNQQNQRRAQRDGSSGFLGVSWYAQRGGWRAAIRANGASKTIGVFGTPEEAHEAYLAKKRLLHEGCTL